MDNVARVISAAIAVGVPMFNSGDAQGCAAVYGDCAASLLSEHNLPQNQRQRLAYGLQQASLQDASAHERAWAMRHALDSVLDCAIKGTPDGDVSDGDVSSSDALVDFSDRSISWTVVDDRVMGGTSRSTITHSSKGASFEGNLVTAGGGFASVRCLLKGRITRMAGTSGLVLLTDGSDGRAGYKLTAKTDSAIDGVSYQADLPAESLRVAGGRLRVPFSAFRPTFRGQPVAGAPPLRGQDLVQIGLMLSRFDASGSVQTDVTPGRFWLRLRGLEADRS